MKSFKQTNDRKYICEECGRNFSILSALMSHIGHSHEGKMDYYNKWIIEEGDGKCKNCGKETRFHGTYPLPFCSNSCSSKYNLRKNGSPFSRKEVKEKSKNTLQLHYGKDYYLQTEEGKKNMKKFRKLNSDNIILNTKRNNLKKYGVENVFQREDIKEKCKQTTLKNYGVENISQLEKIKVIKNEKCCRTALKFKRFRYTNLYYQGSYELDFLEKYYDKYPDIQRAPTIKYMFNNKNKIYFPDFYIPSLNLIIECKNSWLLKKDKEILELKENATINKGYKYNIIVNKNYTEFNGFISTL
jgi:hypothetical protein